MPKPKTTVKIDSTGMKASRVTEVFIPGKAYEIVMEADFIKAKKIPDEPTRKARVALKEGEKRNKGRGYRVLVALDNDSSVFLCRWFSEYLATDGYRKLGTADALAMRTIQGRLCEIATLSLEQKERQKEANAKRQEAMAAGRKAKGDAKAQDAAERILAYRDWVRKDALWYSTPADERAELGFEKPRLDPSWICGEDEYKAARDGA